MTTLPGARLPPVTSVTLNTTDWLATALPAESVTVAVIVLVPFGAMVAGLACSTSEAGVVATTLTGSCADTAPLAVLPLAVTNAGPAVGDEKLTVAVPVASVVAVVVAAFAAIVAVVALGAQRRMKKDLVLLAADDDTPLKLEREGWGVPGTRFTYATGRLVLWSKQPGLVDDQGAVLRRGTFQRLAMANPKLAPYGAAALETLQKMGLLQTVQSKWVQGDNIAQTFQFVATGNAELGFVAQSQVYAQGKWLAGSAWVVPSAWHSPIQQDALVLSRGQRNPAAHALLAYLRSEKAKALIRGFGYEL